jgi:hypothetical protein
MRAMSADLEGGVETVKAFWILYAMVLIDSVQAAVSTPPANHQRRLSAAISDTPHRQDQSMLVNVHLEGYVTCSVFRKPRRDLRGDVLYCQEYEDKFHHKTFIQGYQPV